jgi:DNA-binding GntR family transcriptional regulator
VALSGDGSADAGRVLADRLAAALVHHEPGWRLPRPTALARRYNVRPAEMDQAIRELAARHLIRQLPDGQLYRSSPAEYLIGVPGVPSLLAHVDPMGADVVCRSRKVSWRRVPEDIAWTLRIAPADAACSIRCQWVVNGEPAAISTTYLTRQVVAKVDDAEVPVPGVGTLPLGDLFAVSGQPGIEAQPSVPTALHIEFSPPPSAVARGLRLAVGRPAVMVTVRFDAPDGGPPVALTVAALRPEVFRIVIDSPAGGSGVRAVAGEAGPGPVLSRVVTGSGG